MMRIGRCIRMANPSVDCMREAPPKKNWENKPKLVKPTHPSPHVKFIDLGLYCELTEIFDKKGSNMP